MEVICKWHLWHWCKMKRGFWTRLQENLLVAPILPFLCCLLSKPKSVVTLQGMISLGHCRWEWGRACQSYCLHSRGDVSWVTHPWYRLILNARMCRAPWNSMYIQYLIPFVCKIQTVAEKGPHFCQCEFCWQNGINYPQAFVNVHIFYTLVSEYSDVIKWDMR